MLGVFLYPLKVRAVKVIRSDLVLVSLQDIIDQFQTCAMIEIIEKCFDQGKFGALVEKRRILNLFVYAEPCQ